ncbi:hypothetical protein HER32_04450 [Hymenobacter sp. BT18]|uniref:hypothetical protein n=1 Tax=Hymenobacter sp. BT18 TaxID=2835648 RepID=UPI00143EC1C3|nr:hypothetical protein [Hymenobacter sp. BT18]QIX60477.1 hypothetical protein HER32_04450 [Hymenobacter sp. BT18]
MNHPTGFSSELYEVYSVYLDRVIVLKGMLYHVANIFKDKSESIVSRENNLPNFLSASSLVIGDLTGPDDDGWKLYYHTGKNYIVQSKLYESEIRNYEFREANYSVIQAYESFSTFLKDILASYLFLNKDFSSIKHVDYNSSLIDYKESMRKYNSGRNNKDLFKLIRELSSQFRNGENNNGAGMNIYEWYQALSVTRHALVHSEGVIKGKTIGEISSTQKGILHGEFCGKNCSNGYINVNMTIDVADKTLERIAELAYFVFKCLSIEIGKEWRVMKGQ